MKSLKYFPPSHDVGISLRETVVPVENETQRVLRLSLEGMGPNGEDWCGGGVDSGLCIAVRISDVRENLGLPLNLECPAMRAIQRAIFGKENSHYSVWYWNDVPARTFPEVRSAFLRAITLAGES